QCQQVEIATSYPTRRPRNIASNELRRLSFDLTQLNNDDRREHIEYWLLTHEDYLNERSTNEETGRRWYTHKRLRSAYRSLRTNSDSLFTYQRYAHLDIPHTTTSLEGLFSELKRQLHSHHGLSEQRKLRFIKDFLGSKSLK